MTLYESGDLSLVEKKRKQWLQDKTDQPEWFPFGSGQISSSRKSGRSKAAHQTVSTLSPSCPDSNNNSENPPARGAGEFSFGNQPGHHCSNLTIENSTSTPIRQQQFFYACGVGHLPNRPNDLNSAPLVPSSAPCPQGQLQEANEFCLPRPIFCSQQQQQPPFLSFCAHQAASAGHQCLLQVPHPPVVLGVPQSFYESEQNYCNTSGQNCCYPSENGALPTYLHLNGRAQQLNCSPNNQQQQKLLLQQAACGSNSSFPDAPQKRAHSIAEQPACSTNSELATDDISYTEQWASHLPQWHQFESRQRPPDCHFASPCYSNPAHGASSVVLSMNQLNLGLNSSSPVYLQTQGQNVSDLSNGGLATPATYVGPMNCGNGSRVGQKLAIVSPLNSKPSSVSAPQENLDSLSVSFCGVLPYKPSSFSDVSPEQKRYHAISEPKTPVELMEKQHKISETRVAIEQQIIEKRRKKIEEAERERFEIERAERERKLIELKGHQENQQELNKWRELQEEDGRREASVRHALEQARIEAKAKRKERLYRHASLNRPQYFGHSPDGLEGGPAPTVNSQAICANCASDSSGYYSTAGIQLATSSNFSDWSTGSPEEKPAAEKATEATDETGRRSSSLPPPFGGQNVKLSLPTQSATQNNAPKIPADDRPIKPMTDQSFQEWLILAEQLDAEKSVASAMTSSYAADDVAPSPKIRRQLTHKSRSVGPGSRAKVLRRPPTEDPSCREPAPVSPRTADTQPIARRSRDRDAAQMSPRLTDRTLMAAPRRRRDVAPPSPPPIDKRSIDAMRALEKDCTHRLTPAIDDSVHRRVAPQMHLIANRPTEGHTSAENLSPDPTRKKMPSHLPPPVDKQMKVAEKHHTRTSDDLPCHRLTTTSSRKTALRRSNLPDDLPNVEAAPTHPNDDLVSWKKAPLSSSLRSAVETACRREEAPCGWKEGATAPESPVATGSRPGPPESRLHSAATYVIRRDEVFEGESGKTIKVGPIEPAPLIRMSTLKSASSKAQTDLKKFAVNSAQPKHAVFDGSPPKVCSTVHYSALPSTSNQKFVDGPLKVTNAAQIGPAPSTSNQILPSAHTKIIAPPNSSKNTNSSKNVSSPSTIKPCTKTALDIDCTEKSGAALEPNKVVPENPWGDQFGGLNPLLHRLSTRKKVRRAQFSSDGPENFSTNHPTKVLPNCHQSLKNVEESSGDGGKCSPEKSALGPVPSSSFTKRQGPSPRRNRLGTSPVRVDEATTKLQNLTGKNRIDEEEKKFPEPKKGPCYNGDLLAEKVVTKRPLNSKTDDLTKCTENCVENMQKEADVQKLPAAAICVAKEKNEKVDSVVCLTLDDKEKMAKLRNFSKTLKNSKENLNAPSKECVVQQNDRNKLFKRSSECLNVRQTAKISGIDADSLDSSRFNSRNPLYRSFNLRSKQPSEKQSEVLKQLSCLKEQLKKSQKVVEDTIRTETIRKTSTNCK